MNPKIVLKDVHAIINNQKEILKASILIKDGKIEDVFYDFNKIKKDLSDYQIIELDGKICLPAFFNAHCLKRETDFKQCGIRHYLLEGKGESDEYCLGFIGHEGDLNCASTLALLSYPDSHLERHDVIRLLKDPKKEITRPTFKYHGFSDLLAGLDFSFEKYHLINLALEEREHYIELDIKDIRPSTLSFILDSYPKDKILLISKDPKDYMQAVLKLMQCHLSLMDLVGLTSLNAYRLYHLDKRYGEIKKGKEANLLVFDRAMTHLYTIDRGKIV